MISSIIILLWIIFIGIFLYIFFKKMICKSYTYDFQHYDVTEVPCITIDIQGRPYNFLVDTGSAISIIRGDSAIGLVFNPSCRNIQLNSLTTGDHNLNVINIPFTMGNIQVDEDFAVYDTNDLAGFIAKYDITLHGILGKEFLEKHDCKIDYEKQTVTFY